MDKYIREIWQKVEIPNLDPKVNLWCSNYGRLKSYRTNKTEGKIIKGSYIANYNVVFVRLIDGSSKTIYVHRLVAKYFLSPPLSGQDFIIHLDYNSRNNYYRNLQWADRVAVNMHKIDNDNYNGSFSFAKLSIDDVKKLRAKAKRLFKKNKAVYAPLAREFGISETQVKRIVKGENWKRI